MSKWDRVSKMFYGFLFFVGALALIIYALFQWDAGKWPLAMALGIFGLAFIYAASQNWIAVRSQGVWLG